MEEHSRRYGLADFRRYHDNRMTPEEQHVFEKRMLEDPFLREAFEGFEMLHKDGIAITPVTGKPGSLLPGVEIARPSGSGKPVWKYMVAAAVLLIAAFFSYQRFGAKTDSMQLKEASAMKRTQATEKRSEQSQTEDRKTAVVMMPPEGPAKQNVIKPVVPVISKKGDTFPDTDILPPGRAAGINGPEAKADTWQLPGEAARLALGGFRGGGEVIVVSDHALRGKPDSASVSDIVVIVREKPAGDTTKPRKWRQPATERMSFEEYLKRTTRNTLKYGEFIEIKILRNGRLEDLTPEEQDSLQKEMMKRGGSKN